MKGNLYTIFDVVSGEAGPCFNAKNDEVAKRQWVYLMRGDGGNSVQNPEDFHLYSVASFGSESMVIEPDRRLVPVSMSLEATGV